MQDVIFDFRSDDASLHGTALEELTMKLKVEFRSKGIDLTCASSYRNFMETVGLESIQQTGFYWPVGTWPQDKHRKNLGKWCQANLLRILHAISIVPLTEHGPYRMSKEAVEVLLARVRRDLRDPEIHAYLQV